VLVHSYSAAISRLVPSTIGDKVRNARRRFSVSILERRDVQQGETTMKNVLKASAAALVLAAPLTLMSPASAADNPATKADQPTSTRTPNKEATTPESQVDTTKSGETSDRTPKHHGDGAASGEKGASMGSGEATNAAWDSTYQSDLAQEKQLKSGGKSSASNGAASGEAGSKLAPAEKMAPASKLPPKGY
jgi:hypothetical protein